MPGAGVVPYQSCSPEVGSVGLAGAKYSATLFWPEEGLAESVVTSRRPSLRKSYWPVERVSERPAMKSDWRTS